LLPRGRVIDMKKFNATLPNVNENSSKAEVERLQAEVERLQAEVDRLQAESSRPPARRRPPAPAPEPAAAPEDQE